MYINLPEPCVCCNLEHLLLCCRCAHRGSLPSLPPHVHSIHVHLCTPMSVMCMYVHTSQMRKSTAYMHILCKEVSQHYHLDICL